MAPSPEEIERRRSAALAAIRRVYGTPDDEHGATLFVSHHVDEIEPEFWRKHCGVPCPGPNQIFELLVLRPHWGEADDGDVDTLDFTLPDDVTDYVISVEFNENGDVVSVSMES